MSLTVCGQRQSSASATQPTHQASRCLCDSLRVDKDCESCKGLCKVESYPLELADTMVSYHLTVFRFNQHSAL